MSDQLPVVAVVGATATGKSDLGLALAQRWGGEVINADASQFYRGMDIGTAKLTSQERAGVPHHQLDVLDVTQEASVADYQAGARADLVAIRSRGHIPVVVGGSGLYVRALLDRLEIPPTDPQVRARWEAELERVGVAELHARLTAADPEAAARIQPRNGRRIVRALEVTELTGRPFSATLPRREYAVPTVQIGLSADREVLAGRIAHRVDRMWERGLVEEARALEERGLREGRTASRAIGYAQVLAMLDGTLTPEAAREDTGNATRRLVRRQEAWFGPDPRITWLPHDADDLVDQVVQTVTGLT
ncbi:tRNA (adenosine(37)-N6)-dimethylallyltransferase MiaA [Ornithinimicrobium cryptoxanthini]|uniref:tRNA dimethylallyltransferase n=1 Tax=Ornithinimicrobium cryptoxanthini TaxID=2934161 RepID=A0ABY4YN79_9MICO|nr:tRNA (adenosine(37)-N6)-dimethylallyltransferase MiaA [Ornithinimicrobium cryptoxanthini]USQ78062.1 tRNA (adenosine(37)-N6)-dimethylallyltransferase MiaA [Ornithinimicrobium cryptoxanthini]